MKLVTCLMLAAIAVSFARAGDPSTLSSKDPVEEAKKTKSSKSTKTSSASSSGIGTLFEDGSAGVIGDETEADGKTGPKLFISGGITVPISGTLNLGPGPAVHTSDSGSWNRRQGLGSGQYDCDCVCPDDYKPICGSDSVTYTNQCAFTVAQCSATDLVMANSGECALSSTSSAKLSVASNSPKSCPEICTMEYSPVTDENGVKYSNECEMQMAKCKGETGEKKKSIDFSTLLDDGSADPTLVKSTKETEASITTTKTTKSTKSEKTGSASTTGIGSLFEDGSSGVIG